MDPFGLDSGGNAQNNQDVVDRIMGGINSSPRALWEFAKGFIIDGAGGGLQALWQLYKILKDDPWALYETIKSTISAMVNDPVGYFGNVLKDMLASLTDPRVLGALTFDVLVTATGVGAAYMGVSRAGKVLKLFGKLGDKVSDGLQAARKTLGKVDGPECFIAGTLVLTACGLLPIEQVHAGDLVAARDEVTGEVDWKPVVQLLPNVDRVILDLTLTDGTGDSETIGVTRNHPFWVESEGWVSAGELAVGDRIASHDGDILTVTKRRAAKERQDTYNFEVADFHTYFVGEVGAWVHNACPVDSPDVPA